MGNINDPKWRPKYEAWSKHMRTCDECARLPPFISCPLAEALFRMCADTKDKEALDKKPEPKP